MMHQPIDDWHGEGCTCPLCQPCAPRGFTWLERLTIELLGGLGMGLLLALIVDALLGNPVFG